MQVKLIVRSGSQAGKAVSIPAPQCLIGRSEECHIRPQLDAISRKHCVVTTKENEVTVKDLGSRNGTYVNDERIKGEAVLLTGDTLRVGPVEFEVAIDAKKVKKTVIKGIRDVAQRTAASGISSSKEDMSDVSKWLDEADLKEKQKLRTEPETRQFRLDDTAGVGTGSISALSGDAGTAAANQETTALPADEQTKKKKEPGKLPPRSATSTANSKEAAAEMLKKFFNRR